MPFEFERMDIPEVLLIRPQVFSDERGFFLETYKRSEFAANGLNVDFVQDNHSRSARGVLRGLHFQAPPKAQGKLVRVTRGEVFDVAVDVRRGSPTFGKWVGVRLTEDTQQMLYVPVGFAHGFCVLSDVADVVYKVTEEYAPECDGGIIWNDPEIAIEWPVEEPILSDKDAALPALSRSESPFVYDGGRQT